MMSCGGSLTSCARGAGGSVAFLGRRQRSNAPKARTFPIRAQVDGADFGDKGKGGDGAGVIETQTFSGGAGRGGDQTGGACSAARQKA
jgi:hypothetical protein